jgi:NAD(P)-dependent dehydrogenase (short-subunit alcohol dehydrogenase family)
MQSDGKVCIVTGAAGGIGRATAEALAEDGGKVYLCDVNREALTKAAEGILGKGYVAKTMVCDVTSAEDIANLIRAVTADFGRIDVLVNCAGGSKDSVSLLEITEEQYYSTMNLNLKSIFLMMRAVIPVMLEKGKGVIVNVASQSGRRGSEFTTPHYSTAKAGVLGLTRHAAREFGPRGIRCNAVAPGRCLSGPRNRAIWAERERLGVSNKILQSIALRRLSVPEEQAEVIRFLCSDRSSFITGATVDVSGGELCF